MKKLILYILFVCVCTTNNLLAEDFKIGDLYYRISTAINVDPNTVTVTSSRYGYDVNSVFGWFYACPNFGKKKVKFSISYEPYGELKTNKKLTSIVIPEHVTYNGKTYKVVGIDPLAFVNHTRLTSVSLPNTITYIGSHAFGGCTNLESIIIPESVNTIYPYAFFDCSNLETVSIPESVERIGVRVFDGCKALKKAEFASVESLCKMDLGYRDYYHSFKVDNAESSNPLYYAHHLFVKGKEITDLVIPNEIVRINDYAFAGCEHIKTVTMYGVKTIGNSAFRGCSSLESINKINEKVAMLYGVKSIGDYAFCGCKSLGVIYIPESVKGIGDNAFLGCKNATIYRVVSPESQWTYSEKRFGRVHTAIISVTPMFSDFAINTVTPILNEWQKKGKFEKLSDWQRRVTSETRNKKIKELTQKAESEYIKKYGDKNAVYELGSYDTENEVYMIKNRKYGQMLVPVPIEKAQEFMQQWDKTLKDAKFFIGNDSIDVASVIFTLPNGEQYKYNSKASLNYELAQVNYNFGPIEIPSGVTGTQTKGQQLVTTSKKTVGQSDVDVNIPITGQKNENLFAVIIANETYQKEAQVPFALNDGHVFAEYCKKTLGIPEKNLHLVNNATLNNMKYEINWLKQVIEAYGNEASVIFYYAGHGIPDEAQKTAYLLPIDGFGNDVSTGYKLDDLYTSLGNLPSRSVTVFLDACFSGANRDGKMLASARGIAIKAKSSAPQGNMVVFSAAQGDETAYPNNEQQHGMFTYYLLKKIKETSGNVTYKDLGDYVTENVKKQSIVVNGKSQTPIVVPSATVQNEWNTWILNRNY